MSTYTNPHLIPKVRLHTGEEVPCIGLGTFGSDHVSPAQVANAVAGAIRCGYRMLDCASVYGNEDLIGVEISRAIREGVVRRDELFVISKLWNDMHGSGDVLVSCAKSLRDLKLEQLDAYFVHWPFPNYHAPGAHGDSRNPDSVPFSTDGYMAVWRQMERLHDMGLVRNLGMSNMTIPKLKAVLPQCRIKPTLIEMELHPSFQQRKLFDYVLQHGIAPIGYSPLGSPNRPARDKTADDIVDMEMPAIQAAAKNHGIHPAAVCLKWGVQNGQIVIPFSINNYATNLRCITTAPLTDSEMAAINESDANCRLIKGQVFLWPGAKGWEDLWDIDGVITA